ncbi:MAG: ATP synthase subunit I [Gammaproteobacteria bacterium]|nr:ATP synthase subunit I [Gammaproteobacteria bacterium]
MLGTQIAATILCPLLFLLQSADAALSALLGGLVALLGLAWQAMRFFRPYRASQPQEVLAAMVVSEVFKLVFIGLAFALLFKTLDWLEPLPFLIGFILVYLTPLVASLLGLAGGSKRNRA